MRREYILKGDMKVVRRHCGRCNYVWDVPEATRVAAVTASGPIRRFGISATNLKAIGAF